MQGKFLTALALALLWAGVGEAGERAYSPHVGPALALALLWGDTHVHTAYSVDAALVGGGTTLMPEVAYRFARGEEVTSNSGLRVRLKRPLDFIVLADHAENLGMIPQIRSADPLLLGTEEGRRRSQLFQTGGEGWKSLFAVFSDHEEPSSEWERALELSAWKTLAATADRFNRPGVFTAFIGYEWTPAPSGDNLHRNVVFKDAADRATRVRPFSAKDGTDPEALWAFMQRYEETTGGEVLAIPHNGNLSNGAMFASNRMSGEPIRAPYARRRARWEPLVEVTQIKGDGETHALLSPGDEFADFETWDSGNMDLLPKQDAMLEYEYARSALKRGLDFGARLGVNPFAFGMIGSTDSHTGLATADESNFWGKFSDMEPNATRHRATIEVPNLDRLSLRWAAAGYAAVWATENTREALFDAMKRREVYATTGSRIAVRFFGSFHFEGDEVQYPDYVRRGYARGVPMGGRLDAEPAGGSPRFMVFAARDPDGANLDRIQIIKGWREVDGSLHERVYDVAASDGRKIGDGPLPAVGSTVDLGTARYTNRIGAAQLAVVWTDPAFDPDERAFYYARVIEIPTPRWTAHDAVFFGVEPPPDVPLVVQDRAYTSPIWYTPSESGPG